MSPLRAPQVPERKAIYRLHDFTLIIILKQFLERIPLRNTVRLAKV